MSRETTILRLRVDEKVRRYLEAVASINGIPLATAALHCLIEGIEDQSRFFPTQQPRKKPDERHDDLSGVA